MSFVYRTRLASQTDVPVISQPYICGVEHVNSDGEFDLVADAITAGASDFQISFATESFARIDVVFEGVSALTLTQIVDAINAKAATLALEPPLSAYADAGVLRVVARNSGHVSAASALAFIEVLPEDAGYADLAPLLGFARHPHPSARVTAGDLASTSPRAMTQGNRPTSSFIARGEDRTSESFNRALHSLAKNLDTHQLQLDAGIAVPVVLEIAEDSNRLIENPTTGEIDAIDLRGGFADGLDSVLASKIFVGIPHTSSLSEIAKYFSLLDSEWNELLSYSGNGVVRVGTIARIALSEAPGGKTTFSADGTATSPLATNDSFSVYRNALGHASRKQESTPVTSIIDGHTIVCEGAEFEINGVTIGDVVRITGATTVSPTSNNRYLLVEQVISGTEIIVRPLSDEALYPLNDANGESLEVWTNGTFESSLYLHLEPPLPRIPEGGVKLLLGMYSALGDLPSHVLLVPALHSAEEVDGWVLKNLHQNLNLSGAYQGQGQGKGGGFFTEITGRPITLHMNPAFHSPEEVLSEVGGTVLAGNVFEAPKDVTFTLEDVGRSLYLTIGTVVYSDWRVTRLLDARTVELAPPTDEIGNILPTGTVASFQTFDNTWREHRAAVSVVTESPDAGGFHYTKMNDSSTFGKLSFAHLEHLTHAAQISDGAIREVGRLSGTFSAGVVTALQDAAGDPVDVDDLWGVYPATDSGGTRVENSHGGKTLISIIQGTPIEDVSEWAGFFVLYSVSPSGIEIRNMDGTEAALTGDATFQLFTLRSGVGVPVFVDGEPATAAIAIHQASDPEASVDARYVGLRVGWTGNGNGVLITANDPSFAALGASVGVQHVSRGYAMYVTSFAPADGIYVGISSSDTVESRGTGLHIDADTYGNSFDPPDEDGSTFRTGSSKSAGAIVTQIGTDPAAVFIKKDGAATATAANLRLTSSATVVVARATQGAEPAITGVGSAIETVGSIWVRSAAADSAVGNALGGIFSEDVIGAGRYLQPIWGTDPTQHEGYSWSESTSYWLAPPTLGRPGVIFPAFDSGSDPTADILAANYSLFNMPHAGILRTELDAGLLPVSKYIGCIIEITATGNRYSIIAASGDGTDVLFALVGAVSLTPATGAAYKLHGLRWHRSYLDIADWFQIGTWNPLKESSQLPLVTSDPNSLESRVSSDVNHNRSNPNISATPWSPAVEGAALGVPADYPTPGPLPTDPSSATEWIGATFENPYLSTQWSKYANEPRPPFYATNAFAVPPILSFAQSDLIQVGSVHTSDAVYTVESFGGGIALPIDSTHAQTLRQRGRRYIWTDHLRVAVKIRGSVLGLTPVTATVALVTQADVVIATGTVTFQGFIPLDAVKLQSKEVVLSVGNTYDRTSDGMSSSRKDEELEVRITFPGMGATPAVFIQEVTTEQLTDPVYVSGPQVVSGHVMAHGFRHFNPVRGYQTLGPADAKMLDGEDYGLNMSWSKTHDGTEFEFPASGYYRMGTQELRGGAGLIRTTNEPAALASFMAKGYLTASLTWVDDLYEIFSDDGTSGDYPIDLRVKLSASSSSSSGEYGQNSTGLKPRPIDTRREWDDIDALFSAYNGDPTDDNKFAVRDALISFIQEYEEVELGASWGASNQARWGVFLTTLSALKAAITAEETGGSAAFFQDLLATLPADMWLRPEPIRPISIGPNSATILLDKPTHDPLWYAMNAHFIGNDTLREENATISASSFVPPGQTGFILPIDVPHGALLTNLALSMSFLPSSDSSWGIYKDAPAAFWQLSKYYNEIAVPADWEAQAGVYVEIWRFNTLDIGLDAQDFAAWDSHTPEYGYGERIFQTEISLAAETPPSQQTNSVSRWLDGDGVVTRDYYAGRELFKKISTQITGPEDAALRADRRLYSYALIIRFYGGPRRVDDTASPDLSYAQQIGGSSIPDIAGIGESRSYDAPGWYRIARQPTPSEVADRATALTFETGRVSPVEFYAKRDMGVKTFNGNDWSSYRNANLNIPRVKFRGARIGWFTDKAGDKGWG
jgi:hypothetical protein